jgi:hypothetical protein
MKLLQKKQPRRGPQIRDEAAEAEGPTPRPEQAEPKVSDPSLRDLSKRDYKAMVIRAAK